MAFDAAFTAAVVRELRERTVGARIEKIFQPSKESVLFVLRAGNRSDGRYITEKLLVDGGTSTPRLSLADPVFDNPKTPPMFCLLLRKHLNGGKILSVRQIGFERAVEIAFEARDDMGYPSFGYLYAEVMGRFSNLIFCDENRKILFALKTNDLSEGNKRTVLPGMTYCPPPAQEGKVSPSEETREGFLGRLSGVPSDGAAKAIVAHYAGLSPLVAREISFGADSPEALWTRFSSVMERIRTENFTPVLLKKPDGVPFEYSFLPISQYGDGAVTETCESFSRLIERFYADRTRSDALKQRASDILRILTNAEARLKKKLALQREELSVSIDREVFKRRGDLITANIYRLSRGMTEAVAEDYFEEGYPTVTIPLDSRLTPSQNAQRYYKKYRKCKSAEFYLTGQIEAGEKELAYLDTVFDALVKAETDADLSEIRHELYESGYASRMKNYTAGRIPVPKPMEFLSTGGYRILCGKNNSQNDYLTHKFAEKDDLWFHVKDFPGSHVILCCKGKEPAAEDYTEAAVIAVTYSKAPRGQKTAVDYTRVKNVKKPPAAKPGYVTFRNNFSAFVEPDPALAEKLRRK